MSWKCDNCGHKLRGTDNYCPNCAAKAVFRCKRCGKQLDNGKHIYCPTCRMELAENRKENFKKVGAGAVAAASVVLAIATGGKLHK
jgi:predicted amidophosphoribosyltransferase